MGLTGVLNHFGHHFEMRNKRFPEFYFMQTLFAVATLLTFRAVSPGLACSLLASFAEDFERILRLLI